MNENDSKKPDEGRLIDYLLNESSPKERVEIEGLCSQNTEWNKAKTELEHTLGLIENACKKPVPEIEGAMELDPKRRQELESLRSGKDAEPVEQSDQNAETGERALLFKPAVWVPLAAAACAALLVWGPGLMESETQEQQLASAASPPEKIDTNKKTLEMEADKATFGSEVLGLTKSDDAKADPSQSLAFKASPLKESQEGSAEDEALVQKELIGNLDRRALQGADEVLSKRTARNVESLNSSIATDVEAISLADAFAGPALEPTTANFSIDSDSAALPPKRDALALQPSIPAPVPPAPTVPLAKTVSENSTIDKLASKTSEQRPTLGAIAGFVEESATELESKDATSPAFRPVPTDNLDLGNKFKIQVTGAKTEAKRGRKLSAAEQSVETKKRARASSLRNATVSQKKSKPSSWTDLVRKPSSSFLFNQNGQALGEVAIILSEGKTSVIRRMGEIRQGKRFLLTPGPFELRMTDQGGSVVILAGDLKRKTNLQALETKEGDNRSKGFLDGDYEFVAKEAWWLDQNEVRQSLPVNELAR